MKEEKHKEICRRLTETYRAKNADYGDSFSKLYKTFGLLSVVIRLQDKVNRLHTLVTRSTGPQVVSETIEDTLQDLANYAIMALIELNE